MTWDDAPPFVERLIARTTRTCYRLPTDCRVGDTLRGQSRRGPDYPEDLDSIAWHEGNSGHSHPFDAPEGAECVTAPRHAGERVGVARGLARGVFLACGDGSGRSFHGLVPACLGAVALGQQRRGLPFGEPPPRLTRLPSAATAVSAC